MVVGRLEWKERDEREDYSRRIDEDLNAAELHSKLKSGGDGMPYSKDLRSAAAGWGFGQEPGKRWAGGAEVLRTEDLGAGHFRGPPLFFPIFYCGYLFPPSTQKPACRDRPRGLAVLGAPW
jgi:hypothetical protein